MLIKKVSLSDVDPAAIIYDDARRYMAEAGNPSQWRDGYPGRADIVEDISKGSSYVVEDEGEIVGVFHFHIGEEPDYRVIEEGEWKNDDPYGVIHRIAVKYHGRGIADFIYSECYKLCKNIRIDTHKDNLPMQKSLLKNGFEYCGVIHIYNGEERIAFQKC